MAHMARHHSNGLRGQVAKVISDLHGSGRKKNIVQRAASDLSGAATDVRKRLTGGESKRSIAARKAAATRKRNAAKRSLAAKRAAATRRAKASR
jgi:hypothetical protein